MPRQDLPPADFDLQARALWSTAQSQLRRQGTWSKTDVPLLAFYVRSVRLAHQARVAAAEYELVRSGTGMQVLGHVELKVAEGAEASALKYATALLLTPESRKRHGVSIKAGAKSELDALLG